MKNRAINQYLTRYAEPEALMAARQLAAALPGRTWRYGVILPVCAEPENCLSGIFDQLQSLREEILVIVCLNRPDQHPQTTRWHLLNQRWLAAQQQTARHAVSFSPAACWLAFDNQPDTLILLRNEESIPSAAPIPHRHGVGLARKLAADCLLALIGKSQIREPWIFSTDADANLPAGYFSAINQTDSGTAAISLPFVHQAIQEPSPKDWKRQLAQRLYDLRLYLYRAGVAHINPDYAWVALGSTLVISARAYAQVRGFPKRAAGEDFYALNKLAKVGHVASEFRLPDNNWPVVQLTTRDSDRVPFGTGPAVARIVTLEEPERNYGFYNPAAFLALADWRHNMRHRLLSTSGNMMRQPGQPQVSNNRAGQLIEQALPVAGFLDKLATQSIGPKQRVRQFDQWLDAFRLLKAIHALESIYPRLSLHELAGNNIFHRHFLPDNHVRKAFHDLWPIV